ncbi:MAG TPA: gas vesicle protein GvpG [Bacillales bacterium]|nr:gas vesicle protein GvpG [Bacillales bacterium]
MLHKLISSPVNLVIKIAEKIKEEADKELYDLSHIQQKLIELQMLYEIGDIPEELYKEKEEEWLERYEIAKRKELEQWENMAMRQR